MSDPLPLSPEEERFWRSLRRGPWPVNAVPRLLATIEEARTLARAEGLDVDALAEAMFQVDREDGRYPMPVAGYYEGLACDTARAYAAALSRLGERE